ncbi:hypothetical protein L798_05078 [Zootermopsis nevadensis]|uniref:RNMT-activating mini protein n=1 Tax=Zootermopsis nevadensis TaxID=136037 RepID=A0A067RKR0_ZOONE|nr:hypothetical protein L798_05078 [Zootermopsis nevadensis]
MTAEENVTAGEDHAVGVTLTEEQKQFLAACEAEFADRYTEVDQEFIQYKDRVCTPPIVDPWYNKPRRNFDWSTRFRRYQNWGSRNERGHNQGGEGGCYKRQGDRYYGHYHRPY